MSYDQGMSCFKSGDFDNAADHFRNAVNADTACLWKRMSTLLSPTRSLAMPTGRARPGRAWPHRQGPGAPARIKAKLGPA